MPNSAETFIGDSWSIYTTKYSNKYHRLLLPNRYVGTYKVRNEIETKRNETKRNEINENETKRNQQKRNETKSTK